ncbi:MAG: hypothetical protein WD904_04310 [Dehalococcoidia bacterium]
MTLKSPAASTFFSRRRRAQAARQDALPDWVWGAGLGVLVLIFVGAFFLVRQVSGGGGDDTCDKALVPLGQSEISADAFVTEEAALTRVIDFLNGGDRQAAEAAFFGPAHNFTHNVDPEVREKDESLARDLCHAVVTLEDDLATNGSNQAIAAEVDRVRLLLRDIAETLGYPRPG